MQNRSNSLIIKNPHNIYIFAMKHQKMNKIKEGQLKRKRDRVNKRDKTREGENQKRELKYVELSKKSNTKRKNLR